MIRLALVLFLTLLSLPAYAQTVLQVPYDAAQIVWAAPVDPPPAGAGVTRWHAMNCGAADIRIDLPATSIKVSAVAPGPGSYTCTLWAVNNFGKSLPTAVPVFEAGYVPPTPANVRIEVR
jgi:hypothetical protein